MLRLWLLLFLTLSKLNTAFSDSGLNVTEGQNINLSLKGNIENGTCKIDPPQNFTNYSKIIDHETNRCHFTIKQVDSGANGVWSLSRKNTTSSAVSAIDISIEGPPNGTQDKIDIVLNTRAKFFLGVSNAIFCQYVTPDGKTSKTFNGQCEIDIENVSEEHEGIWTTTIGVPESMSTYVHRYEFKVHDLGYYNGGPIITRFEQTNTTMDMSCRISEKNIKGCRIMKPNGDVLIISENIGFSNYRYYITEVTDLSHEENAIECGIRIDNHTKEDLGPWKCIFVLGNNLEIESYIQSDTKYQMKHKDTVTTSRGLSFGVLCEFAHQIDYCWFRSPNKTIYSMSENTNNSVFEYHGNGFQSGHCGIRLKNAINAHGGNWTCYVGAGDNQIFDSSSSVTVNVTGSIFKSTRSTYYAYDKSVNLTCQTFDGSPLERCRFILSNGSILYTNSTSNISDLKNGICSVSVTTYDDMYLEKWHCFGKTIYSDSELFDSFHVYSYYFNGPYPNSNSGLYYLFFLVIFIFIGIFVCTVMFRWRKRRRDNLQRGANTANPEPRSDPNRNTSDANDTTVNESPPPYYRVIRKDPPKIYPDA